MNPVAVAVGPSGKIYVVDENRHRVVRMDDMTGAGWVSLGSLGNGAKQFSYPKGVAVGPSGAIFVADYNNHRVVRFDDMTGAGWKEIRPTGLSGPRGLGLSPNGKLLYIVAGSKIYSVAVTATVDKCPGDPNKTEPGKCGCGVKEDTADTDGDGLINCLDKHPTQKCPCFKLGDVTKLKAKTKAKCTINGKVGDYSPAWGVAVGKLSRTDQSRISKASYTAYLLKAGLAAYKEKDRGLIKSAKAITEADSTEAGILQTALGLSSLKAEERKQVGDREENAFIKGKKAFINAAGMTLYTKFLKETFTEDCCSLGTVRYLGPSSRSLLRNSTAIVEMAFAEKEEASEAEEKEKTKEEGKGKVTAAKDEEDKKKAEEKKKKKITPKKYLGEVAIVTYKDGTWREPSFGKMPKHSKQMKKAAAMAGLKDPSTIVSVVLMAMFALAIVLAIALKRSGPAIACIEGATLAMLLGVVQSLLQGQVSLDDLLFTPLYMATPIWLGLRRGAEAGFMAGFLMGLGLTAASALGSVASWATLAGSGLDLSEHLLAAMFLAITGAVAARIRWPRELPVALPLVWLLFYVSVDRGLIWSFSFYGHAMLGAAMVGFGMLAREAGLLEFVERIFADSGSDGVHSR